MTGLNGANRVYVRDLGGPDLDGLECEFVLPVGVGRHHRVVEREALGRGATLLAKDTQAAGKGGQCSLLCLARCYCMPAAACRCHHCSLLTAAAVPGTCMSGEMLKPNTPVLVVLRGVN